MDEIREFALRFWRGTPVRIDLFGSYARGDARQSSDVDLAITGNVDADQIAAFREALEESDIPYHVDVVEFSQVGAALRERIRKEGICWKSGTSD